MDNQPAMDGSIYNNVKSRAPELENSADCDVQRQAYDEHYSAIPH